jgi:hypothetical protein
MTKRGSLRIEFMYVYNSDLSLLVTNHTDIFRRQAIDPSYIQVQIPELTLLCIFKGKNGE